MGLSEAREGPQIVPSWHILAAPWSTLGQHLSTFTIPGNISGNVLIGTVDKDDGVSAGDIAAGDGRMELQAKGPEHGVCQQRNSQELNGGKKSTGQQ